MVSGIVALLVLYAAGLLAEKACENSAPPVSLEKKVRSEKQSISSHMTGHHRA